MDHGELLGVALRDQPRVAVIAAELPWLDRDLVGTLHDHGVTVVAVGTSGVGPLDRIGVAHRLASDASADDLAALLHRIGGDDRPLAPDGPGPIGRSEPNPTAAG